MELVELKGHTEGPWRQWMIDDDCSVGHFIEMAPEVSVGRRYMKSFIEWEHGIEPDEKCWSEVEANARLIAAAPTLLAIANELANKLAMAGQPAQAFESFASRGIKPPALVMREALGYDEPPTAEGRDGE